MVEIDVKINGVLYDRIQVCNTDRRHLNLTLYSVTTLQKQGKKRFTVAHTKENGLYELLARVFGNGNLKHSGQRKREKEKV